MSDFLDNLLAKSAPTAEVVRPRLASIFEPLPGTAWTPAAPRLGRGAVGEPPPWEEDVPVPPGAGTGFAPPGSGPNPSLWAASPAPAFARSASPPGALRSNPRPPVGAVRPPPPQPEAVLRPGPAKPPAGMGGSPAALPAAARPLPSRAMPSAQTPPAGLPAARLALPAASPAEQPVGVQDPIRPAGTSEHWRRPAAEAPSLNEELGGPAKVTPVLIQAGPLVVTARIHRSAPPEPLPAAPLGLAVGPLSAANPDRVADRKDAQIPPEPTIQVTIGRIEVRAAPVSPVPSKKQGLAAPMTSLDDYLRQRNGGRR